MKWLRWVFELFFGRKKRKEQRIVDRMAYDIECNLCREKLIRHIENNMSFQRRLYKEGKTIQQFEEELYEATGKRLERVFDYEGCLEKADKDYPNRLT